MSLVDRSFKPRGSSLGPKEVGHLTFERICPVNISFIVKFVISERGTQFAGSIEHPAAKACGPRPPCPQILIRESLKFLVGFLGEIGPIDLESEDRKRQENEYNLPNADTAVS